MSDCKRRRDDSEPRCTDCGAPLQHAAGPLCLVCRAQADYHAANMEAKLGRVKPARQSLAKRQAPPEPTVEELAAWALNAGLIRAEALPSGTAIHFDYPGAPLPWMGVGAEYSIGDGLRLTRTVFANMPEVTDPLTELRRLYAASRYPPVKPTNHKRRIVPTYGGAVESERPDSDPKRQASMLEHPDFDAPLATLAAPNMAYLDSLAPASSGLQSPAWFAALDYFDQQARGGTKRKRRRDADFLAVRALSLFSRLLSSVALSERFGFQRLPPIPLAVHRDWLRLSRSRLDLRSILDMVSSKPSAPKFDLGGVAGWPLHFLGIDRRAGVRWGIYYGDTPRMAAGARMDLAAFDRYVTNPLKFRVYFAACWTIDGLKSGDGLVSKWIPLEELVALAYYPKRARSKQDGKNWRIRVKLVLEVLDKEGALISEYRGARGAHAAAVRLNLPPQIPQLPALRHRSKP